MIARAIQFFPPGIPRVYYMGLLAGNGRNINRHYYCRDEVAAAPKQPVVADLLALIRLRSSDPAFNRAFEAAAPDDMTLRLTWALGPHCADLVVGVRAASMGITVTRDPGARTLEFKSFACATVSAGYSLELLRCVRATDCSRLACDCTLS